MPRHYYITPQDYETAAKNGVNDKTLNQRVRSLGWSINKAVSTPIARREDGLLELALRNGIGRSTYQKRIYKLGWSKEKAATTLIQKAVYPEWQEIAKKNGVSKNTFNQRINKYGWSPEQAATTPLLSYGERKFFKRGRIDSEEEKPNERNRQKF